MDRVPLFVDVETTIHNKGEDAIGKMQASPFSPKNRIVYAGYMIGDRYSLFNPALSTKIGVGRNDCLIVAHNIAFDMLHLMRESPGFLEYMEEGKAIWDTMIVEYLLTGQETKWASLDDLSLKYGGTVKDNRIKEYWNNGVSTEDIPP
jgi:hypothetical protein